MGVMELHFSFHRLRKPQYLTPKDILELHYWCKVKGVLSEAFVAGTRLSNDYQWHHYSRYSKAGKSGIKNLRSRTTTYSTSETYGKAQLTLMQLTPGNMMESSLHRSLMDCSYKWICSSCFMEYNSYR